MNQQILDFVTKNKLKSYFYGAAPYVVVDGHEVPVLMTNDEIRYSEGSQGGWSHVQLAVEKYMVPEQYYNIALFSKKTRQFALLKDTSVDNLNFSIKRANKLYLSITFRSYDAINLPIKYRVGDALFLFEQMFSTKAAETMAIYDHLHRVCNERHFIQGLNFNESQTVVKNHKVVLRSLGNQKIPLYLFEQNPILVAKEQHKGTLWLAISVKEKDVYFELSGGLTLFEFETKLSKGSKLVEQSSTQVTGEIKQVKTLSEQDLRIMFIDSILNDI